MIIKRFIILLILLFMSVSMVFSAIEYDAPGFNDSIAAPVSKPEDIFSDYSNIVVTSSLITCAQEFSGFQLGNSTITNADVPMMVEEDFNNDGLLDIIASTYGHTIKFIQTSLNGDKVEFSEQYTFSSSKDPGGSGHITGGDFNGDGKMDLIVLRNNEGGKSGWVGVYINNGDHTFDVTSLSGVKDKIANHNQYWTAHMMDVGDIDGDGKLDFVAGTTEGKIYFIKGNGDGTFQDDASVLVDDSSTFSSGSSGAMVVAAGDIDGDGDIDLVASSTQKKTIKVYLNDGNGHFNDSKTIINSSGHPTGGSTLEDKDGNNKTYVGGATAIDLKDVNADGLPDIVVATDRWKSGQKSRLYALINSGEKTGGSFSVKFSGIDMGQVDTGSADDIDGGAIGDFNKDGKLDVVLIDGNHDQVIAFYKNVTENKFVDDSDFGQSKNLIIENPGSNNATYNDFDSNKYAIDRVEVGIVLNNPLTDGQDVNIQIATTKDGTGNWIFKPAVVLPAKDNFSTVYYFSLDDLGGHSIVYKIQLTPSSDQTQAPEINTITVKYTVKSQQIDVQNWKVIR